VHLPLRVVSPVLDYFLDLLVGKVYILVLALYMRSGPVEQLVIVVAF
jgi:hypothetical protein